MNRLQLEKAVKDAGKKLASAKSTKSKIAAAEELGVAKANLAALEPAAKIVKHKKVIQDTHDDGESSSSSSSSSSAASSTSESASAASASAASAASMSEDESATTQSLLVMTGKRTLREAMGVISGALEGSKELGKLRVHEWLHLREPALLHVVVRGQSVQLRH